MNIIEILKKNITEQTLKENHVYGKFEHNNIVYWMKLISNNRNLYRWSPIHKINLNIPLSYKPLKERLKENLYDIKILNYHETFEFEEFCEIAYKMSS